MICGHSGHGKDQFAEFLKLKFASSSHVALDHCVWHKWGIFNGYVDKEECFNDRRNHMQAWFDEIAAFNEDDPARLGRLIFKENPVYVGCRKKEEFEAIRNEGLFDISIWIDASLRKPAQPISSCSVTPDICNVVIRNNGTLKELKARTLAFKKVVGL